MQVATLDDLQDPASGVGDGFGHLCSLIAVAGIGEDALDEGKRATGCAQEIASPVPVLHIAGMDHDTQQEAERVDEDVALAARDLLACIKALRIERSPPFCAALALWLSMIAAVGLASRPACSRTVT